MKIRKILFWSHLVAGVAAGLIVLSLSASGVLLMYERQILSLVESRHDRPGTDGSEPLTVDELVLAAEEAVGPGVSLVMRNAPGATVTLRRGRSHEGVMDAHTGALMQSSESATRGFFRWLTQFHRWFALEGDSRDTARAIINAASLLFLFMVLTGAYLWLPKVWKWRFFKKHLLFGRNPPSSRARDYNWHHVFGVWAALPLVIIIATGAVFYYSWANEWVYAAFGEQAPESRRGQGPTFSLEVEPERTITLQAAFDVARAFDEDWRTIQVTPDFPVAEFEVDTGTGGQPTRQVNLYISLADGSILEAVRFEDQSPGRRTRRFIRYLHTGEALGLPGQTLFGLASLAACFLVYTGLALAYRRLLQPLFRRRRTGARSGT